MAAGASDVTHGVDELVVADRLAGMSDVVAGAGMMDVAEGAALLEESDEIESLSLMLSMLGEDDLNWSMDLAGIAGQIMVAGDVVADLDMPVLSDFLRDRGNVLRQMAADSIFQAAATSEIAMALYRGWRRCRSFGRQ